MSKLTPTKQMNITAFNTEKQARALTKQLRELAPEQTSTPIIKTSQPFYGVPVPEIRCIAEEWNKSNKTTTSSDLIQLFELLWRTGIREELLLASFILSRRKRNVFPLLDEDFFLASPQMLDNWETTDQFGSNVLGPWVLDKPQERFETCERLVAEDNPWAKRLGLVGTIKLVRTDVINSYWKRVAKMLLAVSDNKEAALPKAVSWVMRERLKGNPKPVEKFLNENAEQLPSIAVRETRNKLGAL